MSDFNLPTDPNERQKLRSSLKEVTNSFARQDSEKDYVNESLKELKEKYDIPVKTLRSLAKIMYNQDMEEQEAELDTIKSMYESLVNSSNTSDDDQT